MTTDEFKAHVRKVCKLQKLSTLIISLIDGEIFERSSTVKNADYREPDRLQIIVGQIADEIDTRAERRIRY